MRCDPALYGRSRGSESCGRRGRVEADRLLERVGGVQQAVLAEGGTRELEPDGEALPTWAKPPLSPTQAARDGNGGDAGQGHRDRAEVVEVHRERGPRLSAQLKRDRGARGGEDEVHALEDRAEVLD